MSHDKTSEHPAVAPEYIDTKQAAVLIGVSARFLELARHQRSDGPPYIKVGKKVLYKISDLHAWMQAQRKTCTADKGGEA